VAIRSNPEIEQIVNIATIIAKDYKHQYVTLEHLTIALIEAANFNKSLVDYGIEVDELLRDLYDYIGRQDFLILKESEKNKVPHKTHSLERVFNRAFTQVLFSSREEMEPIDLFLSLTQESQSHAAYFLLKWGVNRKTFVEFYAQNYTTLTPSNTTRTQKNSKSRSEKILEEFCINLNKHVIDGKIDPVIGREKELEEIA